jgi:hypothetical protein
MKNTGNTCMKMMRFLGIMTFLMLVSYNSNADPDDKKTPFEGTWERKGTVKNDICVNFV